MIEASHLETRPKAFVKRMSTGGHSGGNCSSFHFCSARLTKLQGRPTEATSNARKTPQLRCCGCQPCVCVIFEKCLAFPSNRNVRQAVYLLGSVCSGFHVCFLFVAQALGAIPGYYANDMLPGRGKSPIFKSAGLSGDCSDGDCRNKEWSWFLVLTSDL